MKKVCKMQTFCQKRLDICPVIDFETRVTFSVSFNEIFSIVVGFSIQCLLLALFLSPDKDLN